jgi:hypothetical protein
MDQFLWVEKYRPKTIDECVLPKQLKSKFNEILKSGELRNLMLTGPPGVGKTTVAKALVENMNCDWIMVNGSLDGNIDTLRTNIKTFASTVSLTGGKKVVILDEADNLNCFSGNQEIYCYEYGKLVVKPILEFVDNGTFEIPSWNFKNGEMETTYGYVIDQGEKEVFEVEFEDGTTMVCTKDHPFFNSVGKEVTIEDGELFAIDENNS